MSGVSTEFHTASCTRCSTARSPSKRVSSTFESTQRFGPAYVPFSARLIDTSRKAASKS